MTSTPVKDVGSVLSNLGSAIGNSVKVAAGEGFQTVLSGQAGRENAGNAPDKAQASAKKTPGDSLKAKDDHLARVKNRKPVNVTQPDSEEAEEISPEKQDEVMALLGTAAADMMQEIADTFGISVEELQSIMQEMGMESIDVLDQGRLGELLLKVAGAEDSYALLTDSELYDNYQELLGKLETVLQEAGEELDMEPGKIQETLENLSESPSPREENPAETLREIPVEVLTENPKEAQSQEKETVQERPEEAADTSLQTVAQPEKVSGTTQEPQTEAEGGKYREHKEHSDRGDHGSLFAQDARIQFQPQFSTQVQQTGATSEAWSTDTQDIMRQIMDFMRLQVKADTSNLEMQLHPESLGTLQIHLASKGGVVTANFIAQNEAVKAALESQMVQLKEHFEQQGVKVEAIEVTVQSHAFERNLDQGRGQNSAQEQSSKRTRTRRINLNDIPEVESLEEEDALAAEMMAASGSQVDYTA